MSKDPRRTAATKTTKLSAASDQNFITRYKWPIVAILVLLLGAAFVLSQNRPAPEADIPERQEYPEDVQAEVITPEEEKPDNYVSTALADEPKVIKMPSIGVEGWVEKVGIDTNNQVAVPSNIHIAGWYIHKAKPGQPGLSIINGHYDGFQANGIFIHLKSVQPGQEFQVERGDGTILNYRVLDVKTVAVKDAANWLFSRDPSVTSQLNLITCEGHFDPATGYDERTIVSAELIS